MKVNDLFTLYQGNGLELMHIENSKSSGINFVSRTAQNNGVAGQVVKVDGIEPFPAGYITVALGGSVLSSFVQLKPFYTAFHIMALKPKRHMTLQEKLYWCMCIKANAYKYSYGRQANKTLKNIELPDTVPEWVYNTSVKPIKTDIKRSINKLTPLLWKEFNLSSLFNIKKCAAYDNDYFEDNGLIPYVTRTTQNNGVTKNVKTSEPLNKGNCIVVGGETAYFSYQDKDFIAGTNVTKLYNENLNLFTGLFIVTVANQNRFKYSYGRALNKSQAEKIVVKLPATPDGLPDWVYMENYIKSLPYSDRL
jgi:hypothetical protein